jgi:hypothetical protein
LRFVNDGKYVGESGGVDEEEKIGEKLTNFLLLVEALIM